MKYHNITKPINIKIKYDPILQKITRVAEEPCMLGEGSTFFWLLQNIESAHPEIFVKYPPGKLGFLINNKSVTEVSVLMDGDVVDLVVA